MSLFGTLWILASSPPGKDTGVGCHALLQGIFLAQESNVCLLFPTLAGGLFTTSTTQPQIQKQNIFISAFNQIFATTF